jgi:hypothetical protein
MGEVIGVDAAVGLRDLGSYTLQGQITMSLIDRLKSADLALLEKKLQEKECSDLAVFIEDEEPLSIVGDKADALVNRTMEQHGLDAERAFAHTLPVGTATPTGVNPGNLYKAFREKENPTHTVRETGLTFGPANKIAESLARSSSDL